MTILKKGDTGEKVKELQVRLIELNFLSGVADGQFGPSTEKAVVAFQKANKLFVDGIVGEVSRTALLLDRGVARDLKRMTQDAIYAAAAYLEVHANFISAIAEVESNGGGFHPDGQIKVLYERHIFNRYADLADLPLLAEIVFATNPDLCNPQPGGYVGGVRENTKLYRATKINKEIGLMSASYGRFQIMGFHWDRCQFKDVASFVEFMEQSEDNQLQVLVKFIESDKRLHKACKDQDAKTFAEIYNGKAHKGYDVKIMDALARFNHLHN